MFIDTHAHLYLEQFDEDRKDIIQRAIYNQVNKILLPNIDSTTTMAMQNLCAEYPDLCFPMIGLHPCSVKEDYGKELDHVEAELVKGHFYGIGETGIDLYWDTTFKKQQIDAFLKQIEWSKEFKLPIVIHSRDSLDLTIKLIEKNQDGNLNGVFHCFNGTWEQAQRIQDSGFMMGLGGVITFKKANLSGMVAKLAEEHIILETDAPYLSPTPHRGKRNEPSFIPIIAKMVAQYRATTIDQVMRFTSNNAKKLFSV